MKPGYSVDIFEGDAEEFQTDVLLIKYASRSAGFEARLRKKLRGDGDARLYDAWLDVGETLLIETPPGYPQRYIFSVGTVTVAKLGYPELRQLAHDMLAGLADAGLEVQTAATTLHGVNTGRGNDEVEAFRSLLLGFADAFEEGRVPPTLQRITVVERESHRVELLREALDKFLPPQPAPDVESAVTQTADDLRNILSGVDSFEAAYQKPVADDSTPHVFVAMPFAEEYDDQYYLAIRPAVTENDVLCVRLDQDESTFTGDIMDQVRERIRSAKLVIALLDRANPNVYLEVGYAWGVGTPTILILHEEEEPPFDVQGARLLGYKRIYQLKNDLQKELRILLANR